MLDVFKKEIESYKALKVLTIFIIILYSVILSIFYMHCETPDNYAEFKVCVVFAVIQVLYAYTGYRNAKSKYNEKNSNRASK